MNDLEKKAEKIIFMRGLSIVVLIFGFILTVVFLFIIGPFSVFFLAPAGGLIYWVSFVRCPKCGQRFNWDEANEHLSPGQGAAKNSFRDPFSNESCYYCGFRLRSGGEFRVPVNPSDGSESTKKKTEGD